MENKICPQCGNKLWHNEGISKKNGKPYENYKCADKECGYIEWVDLKEKKELPGKPKITAEIINDNIKIVIAELSEIKKLINERNATKTK